LLQRSTVWRTLVALGQALPRGTAPELASAAVSLIADCGRPTPTSVVI
jgi:hypothetical protein